MQVRGQLRGRCQRRAELEAPWREDSSQTAPRRRSNWRGPEWRERQQEWEMPEVREWPQQAARLEQALRRCRPQELAALRQVLDAWQGLRSVAQPPPKYAPVRMVPRQAWRRAQGCAPVVVRPEAGSWPGEQRPPEWRPRGQRYAAVRPRLPRCWWKA